MFSFINRTVFDIPLTWNRTRFEAARIKCRRARKSIATSVNVQFEKQLRDFQLRNFQVEETITEANEHLSKHEKKAQIFDHFTDIASQSLPNYFDQRMENVRTIIQEHCQAIQKVLHEETDYWKELHSAIDQKLITSNDIHREVSNTQPIDNEQSRSELLNNKSSTPVEVDLSPSRENFVAAKQERLTVALSMTKSNQVPTSINKTYFIKLEETIDSSSSIESPPFNHTPIEVEPSPMYSQPNLPSQLCFSPTILQDEESEPIKHVLSSLDQNQIFRPKVILHRVDRRFLPDHLKTEKTNDLERHDLCIQPKLTENSNPNESNAQNLFAVPELPSKSRSHVKIKNETEPIHLTKTTRKRKQSVVDDSDPQPTTIALRKRKVLSVIESDEKKPKPKPARKRKNKKIKENAIPIREPSPLPIIDQSKHYSTRFSTRTHRSNSFTLSMINTESDDENKASKLRSRIRKKQNDKQTKKVAKSIKSKKC